MLKINDLQLQIIAVTFIEHEQDLVFIAFTCTHLYIFWGKILFNKMLKNWNIKCFRECLSMFRLMTC